MAPQQPASDPFEAPQVPLRGKLRLSAATIALVVMLGSCGSCTLYFAIKPRIAKARAERFCASIAIGDPIDGLEARAREGSLNARIIDAREGRPARITAHDGAGFDRWFCDVDHAEGRVTAKRINHLD